MEFFFLNPWAMVAGGLLISSPIIIHLINRMRFKRIRWAAMEFLLKSQKRNRRRLIIEQLILLALRILIVLLLGFLLGRLVWGAQTAGQSALHVVILDDRLSMTDRWNQNGQGTNSFEVGKSLVKDVAKNAKQANSAQHMKVYLLSDIDGDPIFNDQMDETTLNDLSKKLDAAKPTALHLNAINGVKKAHDLFQDSKESKHILHVVSDFRDREWVVGPDSKSLTEAVEQLLDTGANVTLLDTAHPVRGDSGKLALHHDNLAILDFKAESKVVAEAVPVDFTITIANYSPSAKSTFLSVKVNGNPNFEASRPIDQIEANGTKTITFTLMLAKAVQPNDPGIRDNDPPEERERKRLLDRQYFHISAEINAEETGLQGDNIRDLIVEVRRKVPALVIDSNVGDAIGPGGDLFHLDVAFTAARSYETEKRKLDDLGKVNLKLYPTVYLLNMPQLKDDKDETVVKKLDAYVRNGGSLVYFLGDKVQAGYYNDVLHRKYAGLFPVLLESKPTKDINEFSEEERAERLDRKQKDEQPKILFPDKNSEIVKSLAPFESFFRFLTIDRYWPTAPRFQWVTNPDEPVEELIDLPNRKEIGAYKGQAQDLMKAAIAAATKLAEDEKDNERKKKFDKYPALLENYQRDLRAALGTPYLYQVSVVFDRMLNDPGSEKDNRPKMADLWVEPTLKTIKAQIDTFNKTIRYGDPLVVSRKHGKGRVVACLTPAGTVTKWNDWGGGSPVSWTFPVFIMDLQRVLTKQSDDLNLLVGEKVRYPLDSLKYKREVKISHLAQPELVGAAQPVVGADRDTRPPLKNLGVAVMDEKDKVLDFNFNNSKAPGVYYFTFTTQSGQEEKTAYAFNVDAANESDLRRAEKENLEHNKPSGAGGKRGTIRVVSPGDDLTGFKARIPDFSESAWLYLLLLVILIAEQALAVHLSFHMKGGEGAMAPAATGRVAASREAAAA